MTLRVMVTGGAGQLGQALRRTLPTNVDAQFLQRIDLDIGSAEAVQRCVAAIQPDVIINAAAYTAVDKAESDEAAAMLINASGPRSLANAARSLNGARVIQISTDFVFDGQASIPYRPHSPIAPLSVYGRSKAEGENAVLGMLGDRGLVIRTAWLYSATGNNFVRTMLRLMRERGEVKVVDDQIGTPTSTLSLATTVWQSALRPDLSGIFHWTDGGVASWYDFAVAVAEEAQALSMLGAGVRVRPIPTQSYPTPALRPKYSVLDKRSTVSALDLEPIHWRQQLRTVLQELCGA